MDGYLKAAAGVIITLVLYLSLEKQAKDIAVIIGIIACVLVATIALHYMQPIISFFVKLESLGNFDAENMAILLRCLGIGILTEIISLICADSGNSALGKTLQLAASAIILWLTLPLLTKLIDLVEEVLLFT